MPFSHTRPVGDILLILKLETQHCSICVHPKHQGPMFRFLLQRRGIYPLAPEHYRCQRAILYNFTEDIAERNPHGSDLILIKTSRRPETPGGMV